MCDKKSNKTDEQPQEISEKEKNKLDKELKQSFPASDPPSRSRPGHKRTEDES